MMGTGRENYSDAFSIAATLITVILTINVPNFLLKIIFIICYVAAYILFAKREKRMCMILFLILCLVEIGIVILSFGNVGSLQRYLTRIKEFFVAEERADVNLDDFLKDYKEYRYFKDKEDQKEIGDIVQDINTIIEKENKKDNFLNLKTDKDEVQLFYKLKLSHKSYYYCNIIKALEQYGINCEEMKIDAPVLVCWDVQRLYALYNMRKSMEGVLDKEEPYDIEFDYNDYKVADQFQYSDTFDYGIASRYHTDKTTEEIKEALDDTIINYYQKFILNFKDGID